MLTLLALAMMQPAAQPVAPSQPPSKPDAPHPTITEVLFAVPRQGDANQDGARSATGDEFVELVNPHDKPINLKGYSLRDAKRDPKPSDASPSASINENSFRFTFPDLTLQPGEVAVVFNGFESNIPGPVGTREAAAPRNPKFHNAYVFSVKAQTKYVALANDGDCITLISPDAVPLECIYWGAKQQPETAAVTHKAPEASGSIQRPAPNADFVAHQNLPGPAAALPFSPGKFTIKKK